MDTITNPPKAAETTQQANANASKPHVDFGVDSGNARAQSVKVTPHIKMNFDGTQRGNGGASGQMNNSQQYTRTNAGNNGGYNKQQNGNQFKPNPNLIVDFDLLDNMSGQQAAFGATKLGTYLNGLVTKAKEFIPDVKMVVNYDPEYEAFFIDIGKAHICWVTGLGNRNSAMYRIPTMINNPQAYEMNGNKLTQFAYMPFSGRVPQDSNEAWNVFFDDDIESNFNQVAYHICKIAFPNNQEFVQHVTEDMYLNRRNGFNIVDTKTSNDAYRKELKEMLKSFFDANNPSAMRVPSTDMVAITLTGASKYNQSFNQFNQGFGGGFGQQQGFGGFNPGFSGGFNPGFGGGFGNGFGGGFGNNGGFNIGGFGSYGQTRTKVIAGVKYYAQQETTPTGQKFNVVHITECVELCNVIVENYLKYIIMYFKRLGYNQVMLDLDLSKITQNMRDNLSKFFVSANPYMFGGQTFAALSAYVNNEAQILKCRMNPSFISLKTFAGQFPDLAKDSKFPKNLNTAEDRVRFEEFKRKAGFVQVLNTGSIKLVYDDRATGYLFNEFNEFMNAGLQNMTKEEFETALRNNQNSNQQNNGQQQGFGNGFGGGFGGFNSGFGGGFGNGFGGGFGNGFGGGFGFPGTMGTQPYPVNQGQPQQKANGKPVQGNPYINAQNPMGYPMMGGYPLMGTGMNMMDMGMGGFPGMQPTYYTPGAVANGAFPANGNNGGSGGYIPQ